jgi:DNA-binding phage protein
MAGRGVDIYINNSYYKLMNTSTKQIRPAELLEQMSPSAKARYATDAGWAKASGLPKETLSRLKTKSSCDFRTLAALAKTAGCRLTSVPETTEAGEHVPEKFRREYEEELLDLCASGNVDPTTWRARGPAFFMGGLAVMLASARGFERERYLRLAETLHPGVSTPEVFGMWLEKSPVRPSRFLPMARKRKRLS